MSYSIQPFERKEVIVDRVVSIVVEVYDLVLRRSCKVRTYYMKEDGNSVYMTDDLLTGDDYTNWGSDDDYIVNWVCQKYGLVLTN